MSNFLSVSFPQYYNNDKRQKLTYRIHAVINRMKNFRTKEERLAQEGEMIEERARLDKVRQSLFQAMNKLERAYQELQDEFDDIGAQIVLGKTLPEKAQIKADSLRRLMGELRDTYRYTGHRLNDVRAEIEPIQNYFFAREEEEELEQEYLEATQPVVPRIPEDEPVPRIPEEEPVPRIPEDEPVPRIPEE